MGVKAVKLDMNEVLTIQEVCDFLGVPRSTIYNWRVRGLGPKGFRLGRHLRFLRLDVETWINEQRAR